MVIEKSSGSEVMVSVRVDRRYHGLMQWYILTKKIRALSKDYVISRRTYKYITVNEAIRSMVMEYVDTEIRPWYKLMRGNSKYVMRDNGYVYDRGTGRRYDGPFSNTSGRDKGIGILGNIAGTGIGNDINVDEVSGNSVPDTAVIVGTAVPRSMLEPSGSDTSTGTGKGIVTEAKAGLLMDGMGFDG
jgi:hypothetical protein